jgi:hypothetical protein
MTVAQMLDQPITIGLCRPNEPFLISDQVDPRLILIAGWETASPRAGCH